MWRGFTLDQFMNQCYSNRLDLGKGKQMPVHYGDKKINFVTISSPVATQIPQVCKFKINILAVGSAYAYKMAQNNQCVVCYFGDGTASEGDAFVGFNFAITLKCPVIFICRNNAYAISTHVKDQYSGDGIISRCMGMGIPSIRVDGNDTLAVYFACQMARDHALKYMEPVFIEAMTYRVGHHSTSDDSSAYRSKEEVDYWNTEQNPVQRLKKYMTNQGFWNDNLEAKLQKTSRSQILEAFNNAEKELKPPIDEMFTDVYDKLPLNLIKQKEDLHRHLKIYGKHYPLDKYA
ncbi:2-oxoisovalerate dehydrogenase subunit alpha, mitochondrial-like isoform X1 [Gordionus sp. m RMFG-2023]|uniref:2-oxoisovalerate dehydrogenase subunit alpha, mitochondrial-like isoform X1 n=1 Tax=Gordionus sp. m RMFG-2023 TaxID=3053472 RepID=UPI0031FDED5D